MEIRNLISFVLTEKGMGYRRILDKELAKKSIEISPALEVGRTDIITTLPEECDGISYLFIEYVKRIEFKN